MKRSFRRMIKYCRLWKMGKSSIRSPIVLPDMMVLKSCQRFSFWMPQTFTFVGTFRHQL